MGIPFTGEFPSPIERKNTRGHVKFQGGLRGNHRPLLTGRFEGKSDSSIGLNDDLARSAPHNPVLSDPLEKLYRVPVLLTGSASS